jgi:hypothetical protein
MNARTVAHDARRLALAAVVGSALACGHFGLGRGANPPALLFFANQSLDQADVYAVAQSGESTRIGTVFPGRTDTLTVPADMAERGENVNIVARLLARSMAPRSGPVSVRPGDHLAITLPSDERTLIVLPAP